MDINALDGRGMDSVHPKSDMKKHQTSCSWTHSNISECTQMVQTLPTKSTREEEYWRTVSSRKTLSICGMCTFLSCRTTTIRIHRKSQSFKLHDRTQAGPPKELQCARAMENVRIINASAKEQESLTQPNVTQQLRDLTRLNLEGLVAYTFSFSTRSPL